MKRPLIAMEMDNSLMEAVHEGTKLTRCLLLEEPAFGESGWRDHDSPTSSQRRAGTSLEATPDHGTSSSCRPQPSTATTS